MHKSVYKGGRRRATHCHFGHDLTDENRVQRYDKYGRKSGSRCIRCTQSDLKIRGPYMKETYRLKKDYGLNSFDEAKAILESQGGKCAICGIADCVWGKGGFKNVWHIDHKHDGTPNHRGVLCAECNHTIGRAKDNPVLLRRMAEYIESYQ